MDIAIAAAAIVAETVTVVFLCAGLFKSRNLDADSAQVGAALRWYHFALAASIVALVLNLFDLDVFVLLNVATAACSGMNVVLTRKRLASRRSLESSRAERAAREHGLPWVEAS